MQCFISLSCFAISSFNFTHFSDICYYFFYVSDRSMFWLLLTAGEKAEIKRSFRFLRDIRLFLLLFVWWNLGQTSHTSAENLFRRCFTWWHSSATMGVTQLFSGEYILERCIWKVFHHLPAISLYFASPSQHKHIVLCWQNSGTMESFFTSIWCCYYAFEWRNNENNYTRNSGISLLLRRVDMSDFPHRALKAGRQNCNNAFRPKMMNSRLSLLTFERRNISILKTIAPLTNRARVSCDSTTASRKTRLDANMIGRCHGDWQSWKFYLEFRIRGSLC